MPHMSNLPWTAMFLSCLLSMWTLIVIFNYQSKTQEDNNKNSLNKKQNKWQW